MQAIYLDHQATTPMDEAVLEEMKPWLVRPGNPHAQHSHGSAAARAVENAVGRIADSMGAQPGEVILTSGATEAAALALTSLRGNGAVLTSAIEHPCVLKTLEAMATAQGRSLSAGDSFRTVACDSDGLLDLDLLENTADVIRAICVMAVNNEIGTIQPLADIAGFAQASEVPFLSDCTQALGRIEIDMESAGIDAAWISSHKIYGPAGIGALIWRSDTPIRPVIHGGDQQQGRRSGTIPVALTVGFGKACELAVANRSYDEQRALEQRDLFLAILADRLEGFHVNGSIDRRIAQNLNIALDSIDAEELMARLPHLSISTGSACSSGAEGASHVLLAIADDATARSSIRIGFGRDTSNDDISTAAAMIAEAAGEMRSAAIKRSVLA